MGEREIAIKAEGLGKCYRLGLKEEIKDSLAQAVFDIVRKPIANYRKYRSLYNFDDPGSGEATGNILWALQNISFEVAAGEKIGIIGKNGSGKSTLLKVLSRITHPVEGRAVVHGRISSLLEVGTGFHPELTGRENIYLNGTILGMKKKEIDQRFDEIVEFSGVEKFLDTPVKRYSSGMRVRLAFSVAAHLEPEILIIDEVLAVGDSEFQDKCLHKMKDIGKSGRTVLFVSHNMGAILQLCERVLWLEKGTIKRDGSAQEVITSYLEAGTESHAIWRRSENETKHSIIEITEACLMQPQVEGAVTVVAFNKSFDIRVLYQVKQLAQGVHIIVRICDLHGNIIFTSWDTDTTEWKARPREAGWYLSVCQIPSCLLRPGRYTVSIGFHIQNMRDWQLYENILSFNVSNVGYIFNEGRLGIITPELKWQINRLKEQSDIINYDESFESFAKRR